MADLKTVRQIRFEMESRLLRCEQTLKERRDRFTGTITEAETINRLCAQRLVWIDALKIISEVE